jgi:starvation-inducible DNA-binding protein
MGANAAAEVVQRLGQALADTAVETAKTQTFHWNVRGMSFGSLHELFEDMYKDHFKAQDRLAERLRALDMPVDGRLAEYLKKTAIQEHGPELDARTMVTTLCKDQEGLSGALRTLAIVADEQGDVVTHDIATERAEAHDKFAWMLRAHLA